eukprot:gene38819-44001_t
MALAFIGSAMGAVVAFFIPRSAFDPIVLVVLVAVGAYVLLKPEIGATTALRFTGRRHTAAAMGTGLAVGFYDGALGPGTGSFFVFLLVGLLGYNFLEGSAKARLANWATNLGALVVFVPQGVILWKVALLMGLANLVGGYLGARVAVARGAGFVRVFFIVVVSAFIIRIGGGAEIEVKRSRFLCTVARVEDEAAARAVVDGLRKQHHDARHHCSAFVLGPDGA